MSLAKEELKQEVLQSSSEALKEYAESESETKKGFTLRKIANVISKVLPFLKYIKFNKK